MRSSKALVILLLLGAVASAWALGIFELLSLDALKARQLEAQAWVQARPLLTGLGFFAIYVAVTGLSLPGAAVLTLAAGALFGLWWGVLIASFASSVGATLAFLATRFLFRDSVQARFGERLKAINAGIERDGGFYLFTLRLVPAFPFFVINLLMGLTPLKARTFYWVSQLGMLPGTLVYVNAGTQLARIDSLSGLLSPALIGSFALLGLFPLLARWGVRRLEARKVYRGWPRPRRFDRNLVVIGAGSAGLVSAYIAAAVRAKVTLVEKERMGGDCLNTGCVPSKALIRSARLLAEMRRARDFGLDSATPEFRFGQLMERVQQVIRDIEPHDSVERYTGLGVEVLKGEARITSPWTVEIDGRSLSTRSIIIATGARPTVPALPGLEDCPWYSSDTIWNLREAPGQLLVLGAGPIGCELAQCFARLGVPVTQVQRESRILPREDADLAAVVQQSMAADGVVLHSACEAEAVLGNAEEGWRLRCRSATGPIELPFTHLLVAVGRTPRVEGFGLETLGIPVRPNGTIESDATLATRYPNIRVCGDVAGPYQFTHAAAHQAWYASVNSLFGRFRRYAADYRVIPWCTFTGPELARVGFSEDEARAAGVAYEVTRYGLDDLDRAIADSAAEGFVKVLTVPGKDRILGAAIVGEHAGELLAEFVLAMRHGLGLNKLLSTIHIYPTWSEAAKYAAGTWKRAHAPETALRLLERYHRWERGGA